MRSKIERSLKRLGLARMLVVAAVFAIASVVTVMALHGVLVTRTTASEKRDRSKPVSYRNLVALDRIGQPIVLDRETGTVRVLDQDEKARLAQGLKQLINNTTDGLVEVRREDGSVSMDLDGHFQDVMLARREADGSVTESCVNDLEAAADFFQIDPQLLGLSRMAVRNAAPATSGTAER